MGSYAESLSNGGLHIPRQHPPPPNMAVMVALKSVLETGNAHK